MDSVTLMLGVESTVCREFVAINSADASQAS